MISDTRRAEIRAIVETKAIQHAELRRPLGLAGFRRVLARDGVALTLANHPRMAQLVPSLAGWTIIVDRRQPREARLVCGCHELAHLWLHHDPFFARHETTIYDKSPPWYDAVREEEADAFAELLVRGPEGSAVTRLLARRPPRENNAVTAPPDPDGDAFVEMIRRATPALSAPPAPPASGPTVQFAIERTAWSAVRFDAIRRAGPYPHYDNTIAGPNHELVTCSVDVARAMVAELARAGYKRQAVRLRRMIRETRPTPN